MNRKKEGRGKIVRKKDKKDKFSYGCVFWRLDKGLSKAESCCFIVISSGSICWNQSVCERL